MRFTELCELINYTFGVLFCCLNRCAIEFISFVLFFDESELIPESKFSVFSFTLIPGSMFGNAILVCSNCFSFSCGCTILVAVALVSVNKFWTAELEFGTIGDDGSGKELLLSSENKNLVLYKGNWKRQNVRKE